MHFLHDVSTPMLVLNYRSFYDILTKPSTTVGSIMQQIAEKRSVIAIKRSTRE